ncbi:MnhB domain-containing protein [Marinilactibacillus sp. XAAS-LB27]|uniref:MnhB domain-containing protein n=1 Tax=Marinilactibacillus sp. XAAS-LB27 TaxID=3114538 RepID=UPI002E189628|nr:MnhB domain-containing protein [Marinilactibacillus sp. XAAS-LB27]
MMQSNKTLRIVRVLFALVGAMVVIFTFSSYSVKLDTPLMDYLTADFYAQTGAQNAVGAIYLNYRVFDTLFEALMLVVSVIEVINVSWSNIHSEKYQYEENNLQKKNNSEIITRMMGMIYPFVLLIGLYTIINGHVSPGGGFQGGAILATALITRYLVYPNFDLNLDILERLEKLLFFCILLLPILYIFMELGPSDSILMDQIYLITLNLLIGFKVFSGLSIIFYRFVFYENQ